MDDLQELRAALEELAKSLTEQRRCVIRIKQIVERKMDAGAAATKEIADTLTATVAGVSGYGNHSSV